MRIIWLPLAAIVLAASYGSSVQGQTTPASYGSILSGMIQSSICSSDTFASGDASGDLHGSFFVAFDCKDGSIAGGTWIMLVTAQGPGGMTEIRGTLRGQVVNGAFEADGDGNRTVVRGVLLAVTEGTGEYAAVAAGTGSLDATADLEGAPQFVGTIGLTF